MLHVFKNSESGKIVLILSESEMKASFLIGKYYEKYSIKGEPILIESINKNEPVFIDKYVEVKSNKKPHGK